MQICDIWSEMQKFATKISVSNYVMDIYEDAFVQICSWVYLPYMHDFVHSCLPGCVYIILGQHWM